MGWGGGGRRGWEEGIGGGWKGDEAREGGRGGWKGRIEGGRGGEGGIEEGERVLQGQKTDHKLKQMQPLVPLPSLTFPRCPRPVLVRGVVCRHGVDDDVAKRVSAAHNDNPSVREQLSRGVPPLRRHRADELEVAPGGGAPCAGTGG